MTIYLDNAATSWPKPPGVLEAAVRQMRMAGGNPGRAGHTLSTGAETVLQDLRRQAANLFGAPNPQSVVFGLNGTDCLNMAMHGVLAGDWGGLRGHAGRGRRGRQPAGPAHVITSHYDHNSVQRMLNAFAADGRIQVTRVGRKGEPIWRAEDVLRAVRPNTILVALTHASNVTGAVGDVAAVGAGLRRHSVRGEIGAPGGRPVLLIDAAQTAGTVPIAMGTQGIDLLAMPGHKGLLGPSGTGLLILGAGVPSLAPWRLGGTGVDSTNPTQPDALPFHLEAGTPNMFGLAGLRASLAFVEKKGIAAIGRHEQVLRKRLIARLQRSRMHGWIRLHAAEPDRTCVGVLSMDFGGRLPESDVAAILNADFGIAVRSGLHCAPWVHALLGTEPMGTLRVSPGVFSTTADVDRLAEALLEILTAITKSSGKSRTKTAEPRRDRTHRRRNTR